ncbi:hypothetical protein Lal_00000203 [Lupinus albus]|nr:hypothetical protein Lal_00000203 [Lupinus albus]
MQLFNLNNLHNGSISEFGKWVEGNWVWNFNWRRQFFNWELELYNSFLNDLKHSALQADKSDTWEWQHNQSKKYTVKSAYSILINQGQDPSNGGSTLCSFCNELPETTTHLFSSCSLSYAV